MVAMSTIDASGNIHRGEGPGGGQFAGKVNTPPGSPLGQVPVRAAVEQLLRQRAALINAGYAPATAGPSFGSSPRATEGIDTWWEEHFRRAEVRIGDSYLQMPDDYTPGMGRGRSLTGNRRTHRMLYEGPGIALRMPSASAIRRFSAENPGQSFDVPIQAEGQGGQVVSGYVRVTAEGPGRWSVDALGMPPQVAWKVGEGVAAVLESRRPSRALQDAGDLIQRRRERYARAGAVIVDADNSSWVSGMGYNAQAGEMVITLGQRTYGYRVTGEVFEQVRTAHSAGAAYNRLVKGSAPRVAVDKCGSCGRWFNVESSHTCMGHRAPTAAVKPFNEHVRAHVLAAAGAGEQ